jgi:hypothetical protein
LKGGFLSAVAFVIAVLMVCLTCGAYNLQVNTALQCRRAPVQKIVDGLTVRPLKFGDKGFKPCDCNTRRQNDDREQSTKVAVVNLTMVVPAVPVFPITERLVALSPYRSLGIDLTEPGDAPISPPPQSA